MPEEFDPAWEYFAPDPDLVEDEEIIFDVYTGGVVDVDVTKRTAFKVECAGCGRPFSPLKSVLYQARSKDFYCSHPCFWETKKVLTKTCRWCGKVFTTVFPQKVFCSNRCSEPDRRDK